MKKIIILLILSLTQFSFADDNKKSAQHFFKCKETEASIKDNGGVESKLLLEVSYDTKNIKLMFLAVEKNPGYSMSGLRDEHDSYQDKNKDGENDYNLDEDYNRKTEARYIIPSNEAEDTVVFIQKTILYGNRGQLSLSSGQANDGDGGPMMLWGRSNTFDCK